MQYKLKIRSRKLQYNNRAAIRSAEVFALTSSCETDTEITLTAEHGAGSVQVVHKPCVLQSSWEPTEREGNESASQLFQIGCYDEYTIPAEASGLTLRTVRRLRCTTFVFIGLCHGMIRNRRGVRALLYFVREDSLSFTLLQIVVNANSGRHVSKHECIEFCGRRFRRFKSPQVCFRGCMANHQIMVALHVTLMLLPTATGAPGPFCTVVR